PPRGLRVSSLAGGWASSWVRQQAFREDACACARAQKPQGGDQGHAGRALRSRVWWPQRTRPPSRVSRCGWLFLGATIEGQKRNARLPVCPPGDAFLEARGARVISDEAS